MKSISIKKIKSFMMMMIGAVFAFIIFSQLSLRALINNGSTIWRLILVEYPPILLGVMFIEGKVINKVDSDKLSGNIFIGIAIGTFLSTLISYVFSITFITDHTTLYSKIIYIAVLLIAGYKLYDFFKKRKWNLSAKILVLLILILVPGGIIINESFTEFNAHEYRAVVEDCRVTKTSKSTTYHVSFKGMDEDIPLKKYHAKDVYEYNNLQQGSIVKIKKYTGILGLPVVKIN